MVALRYESPLRMSTGYQNPNSIIIFLVSTVSVKCKLCIRRVLTSPIENQIYLTAKTTASVQCQFTDIGIYCFKRESDLQCDSESECDRLWNLPIEISIARALSLITTYKNDYSSLCIIRSNASIIEFIKQTFRWPKRA